MTKQKLWAAYIAQNPAFETGNTTFTAAGLRKFFDRTCDAMLRQGARDEARRRKEVDDITDQLNGLEAMFSKAATKGAR